MYIGLTANVFISGADVQQELDIKFKDYDCCNVMFRVDLIVVQIEWFLCKNYAIYFL